MQQESGFLPAFSAHVEFESLEELGRACHMLAKILLRRV
jgi:hypothetical protein